MNSKMFWYTLMAGAVFLWFATLFGGRFLFPHDRLMSWTPFLFVLAIHVAEIPLIIRMFRQREGFPIILMKSFLFGFTWWLPYKRGVFDK